jgi:hypothetical protein
MTSPLLGSLATTIGKAMSGLFLDATLSRDTASAGGDPWNKPPPTTATYACKAIHEDWGVSYVAGGLVNEGDVKVLVLASTLTIEPLPGDRVTIRSKTFTVVPQGSGQPPVTTDPAKAVWTLRACA